MKAPIDNRQLTLPLGQDQEFQEETLRVLYLMYEKMVAPDSKFWTIEDVANVVQTSVRNAQRMAKQPGFPRACRPPTGEDSQLTARYVPAEVRAYIVKARVNTTAMA